MYIENHLTDDDMQRAHDNCPNAVPATLLAGSYLSLLEAVDIFTRESVNPITSGLLAPTPRETVILGLYYRSLGFCRTAIELKSVVHQQSLTSAERSVIELYIDMELVSRAKQTIKVFGVPFRPPTPQERSERLPAVLRVLYLIFNEGYTSSAGVQMQRLDLVREAIR